jgi:hypothetical protein
MLAGLPVLANADLRCGKQYILPSTGRLASADTFHLVLTEMLADTQHFQPRETAMGHWTWPHTVKRFAQLMEEAKARKARCRMQRELSPFRAI